MANYEHSMMGAQVGGARFYQTPASNGVDDIPSGGEPKLREQLYEIEKLMTDNNLSIQNHADRMFGGDRFDVAGDLGGSKETSEPSIAMLVNRILNLVRTNREEVVRFNRIG